MVAAQKMFSKLIIHHLRFFQMISLRIPLGVLSHAYFQCWPSYRMRCYCSSFVSPHIMPLPPTSDFSYIPSSYPMAVPSAAPPSPPEYIAVTFVHYPGCWLPAVLLCDPTAALLRMGPFIRAEDACKDTRAQTHTESLGEPLHSNQCKPNKAQGKPRLIDLTPIPGLWALLGVHAGPLRGCGCLL